MAMQESGEMYLETILVLSKERKVVRSIDVCEYMGFSKPSVSRAMSKLREDHYIEMDRDNYITLTPEGLKIASKIYERHTYLSRFFKSIGVSDDTASADACKIEHDISDETFEAIKKIVMEGKKE
jgi:Mn-dependent DtxR family transcriptional regulator